MTEYSGFWIRVGAYLIDAIILGIVGGFLGLMIGVGLGIAMAGGGADETAIAATAEAAGNLIGLILGLLYFALMESSVKRGTVGKLAVGIEVCDEQGRQLTLGRAVGRYFAKFLSIFTLGIGFLMVAWTDRKRGLHDMIAGTVVVRRGSLGAGAGSAEVFR